MYFYGNLGTQTQVPKFPSNLHLEHNITCDIQTTLPGD